MGIIGALALRILVPASDRLPFMIVNILLVVICTKIMVIIHEAGHLLTARWAGATPKRMVLGTGYEIYRTEFKGVKIIFNSIPLGGEAAALFGDVPHLRWRNAFYIVGGPLFNFITILILYLIFGFDFSFFTGSHGFSPASAMILASSIGVLNLIPARAKRRGQKVSTDGLRLLKVLFASRKTLHSELTLLKHHEDYFQAFDYYESKQYDDARKIYQSILHDIPDEFSAQSMLALIELKCLRFDEALQLFKNLEVRVNTKEHQGYKGIIYNNIAFTYLLRNEPAEALQYANVAVNLLKNEPNIIGTYAATLIENGDDNGIAWMMNEIDTDHPNDHTIMASVYVALGYHLKGDYKSRDKYLKFVYDNQDRLDNDTRFLVERNLERMNGR